VFAEGGGDFNCSPKEQHSDAWKNTERARHNNERNYLGDVLYSRLQERYFLSNFPVIVQNYF
jgi:hypothetical protein